LRAFARSLTGNRDRADDLVQDAVLRALGAASQFRPGTNFKAWIFTILRNLHFNEFRRNRGFIRPLDAADLETHATAPAQQAGLELDDFRRAFATLPAEQRGALMLIGADGFRYDEVAAICGCPIGTIKSRVTRARCELKRLLGIGGHETPATGQTVMPRRGAAQAGLASRGRQAKPIAQEWDALIERAGSARRMLAARPA
jgi:RNA polymerase sigma-70 factor (ECF subfamily)